jgi:integrase
LPTDPLTAGHIRHPGGCLQPVLLRGHVDHIDAATGELLHSWGRIRTAAGLTSTRFHDMRHTCVSLLLHLGVPPDMVREIVGHSDLEVTMTIYAHTALDEKRQALAKLGDALS